MWVSPSVDTSFLHHELSLWNSPPSLGHTWSQFLRGLVRRIGKHLQHLGLLSRYSSSIPNLLPLIKLHYLHLDDTQQALTHVVSEVNITPRYLDLCYDPPIHYMHHLPTHIRSNRVEEITLTFSISRADDHCNDMRDELSTLDAMLAEAFAATPRQSFVLHIYISPLPKPGGEEFTLS